MILFLWCFLGYLALSMGNDTERESRLNDLTPEQLEKLKKLKSDLEYFLIWNSEMAKDKLYEPNVNADGEKVFLKDASGAQGRVFFRRLVYDNKHSIPVAIKHVVNEMGLRLIVDEMFALRYITDHDIPYCVKLLGTFKVDRENGGNRKIRHPQVFVVMNFLGYSSLSKVIKTPVEKRLITDERHLCAAIARLLVVLWHLREHNILHRDIKPPNIMVDQRGNTRLTDFGMAIFLKDGELRISFAGTMSTAAPEVVRCRIIRDEKNGYTFPADLWSLFMSFWMYCKNSDRGAFDHSCVKDVCPKEHFKKKKLVYIQTYENMKNMKLDLKDIPPKLAALMRKVFVLDPNRRPSLEEVMLDRWFKDNGVNFPGATRYPRPSVVKRMNKEPSMHIRQNNNSNDRSNEISDRNRSGNNLLLDTKNKPVPPSDDGSPKIDDEILRQDKKRDHSRNRLPERQDDKETDPYKIFYENANRQQLPAEDLGYDNEDYIDHHWEDEDSSIGNIDSNYADNFEPDLFYQSTQHMSVDHYDNLITVGEQQHEHRNRKKINYIDDVPINNGGGGNMMRRGRSMSVDRHIVPRRSTGNMFEQSEGHVYAQNDIKRSISTDALRNLTQENGHGDGRMLMPPRNHNGRPTTTRQSSVERQPQPSHHVTKHRKSVDMLWDKVPIPHNEVRPNHGPANPNRMTVERQERSIEQYAHPLPYINNPPALRRDSVAAQMNRIPLNPNDPANNFAELRSSKMVSKAHKNDLQSNHNNSMAHTTHHGSNANLTNMPPKNNEPRKTRLSNAGHHAAQPPPPGMYPNENINASKQTKNARNQFNMAPKAPIITPESSQTHKTNGKVRPVNANGQTQPHNPTGNITVIKRNRTNENLQNMAHMYNDNLANKPRLHDKPRPAEVATEATHHRNVTGRNPNQSAVNLDANKAQQTRKRSHADLRNQIPTNIRLDEVAPSNMKPIYKERAPLGGAPTANPQLKNKTNYRVENARNIDDENKHMRPDKTTRVLRINNDDRQNTGDEDKTRIHRNKNNGDAIERQLQVPGHKVNKGDALRTHKVQREGEAENRGNHRKPNMIENDKPFPQRKRKITQEPTRPPNMPTLRRADTDESLVNPKIGPPNRRDSNAGQPPLPVPFRRTSMRFDSKSDSNQAPPPPPTLVRSRSTSNGGDFRRAQSASPRGVAPRTSIAHNAHPPVTLSDEINDPTRRQSVRRATPRDPKYSDAKKRYKN